MGKNIKIEATRGFPQNRGTILGVPIIRTIVFWGLYWGLPIYGNYHYKICDLGSRDEDSRNGTNFTV